jgi:hypothetical protein
VTPDDGRVITLEDWALIRRLAAEGVPKAQIARRLGVSRTTVVKAVGTDAPPCYVRRPAATSFTPFEARVRAMLAEEPELPAVVIAERVGWTGSITWFRENVKRLRPEHRRIDPADRLVREPGDAAQCDLWFPPKRIPLEDGTAKLRDPKQHPLPGVLDHDRRSGRPQAASPHLLVDDHLPSAPHSNIVFPELRHLRRRHRGTSAVDYYQPTLTSWLRRARPGW